MYSCMCIVYEKTQKTLPCTNLNTEALHTIFAYKNIFFFVTPTRIEAWDVLLPFRSI
jgi:hypothetical protein